MSGESVTADELARLRRESPHERAFRVCWRLLAADEPEPEQEYRFHPSRRWRFDFAWTAHLVAVECDGGQWQPYGGRHARDSDRVKLNTAAATGWRVLRFSGRMLADDPAACVEIVRRALSWEPAA